MTQESSRPGRLSIEERAARRARITEGEQDRYSALLETLRGGRVAPSVDRRRERLEWHPIARTLVLLALITAVGYLVAVSVNDFWRQQSVDAWAGPDRSVQSGQRLAGCPAANALHDDLLPTWVRYRGTVYVMSDRKRPSRGAGQPGRTGFIESGYTLGIVRIVLLEEPPRGQPPRELLLITPGSAAATIYRPDPSCS